MSRNFLRALPSRSRKTRRSSASTMQHFRPTLEPLEQRTLLSVQTYNSWDFEGEMLGQYTNADIANDFTYSTLNSHASTDIVMDTINGTSTEVMRITDLANMVSGGLEMTVNLGVDRNELYFTYNWKFDNEFCSTSGGKLPGIFGLPQIGADQNPGDNQGFGYHMMYKQAGSLIAYHYDRTYPRPETTCPWTTSYDNSGHNRTGSVCCDTDLYLANGTWYNITERVVMNSFNGTTPIADGINEIWVDGKRVFKETGLIVMAKPVNDQGQTMKIDAISITHWYGGPADQGYEPTRDCYGYIDNMKVWGWESSADDSTWHAATNTAHTSDTLPTYPVPITNKAFYYDTLVTAEGTFSNADYKPTILPHYGLCEDEAYLIDAGADNHVHFTLNNYELGDGDFLLAYNGSTTDAVLLKQIQGGSSSSSELIESTDRYMFVRFSSDRVIEGGVGDDGWTGTVAFSTPLNSLAAPTELTASTVSSSQINLTWYDNNSSPNETSFQIDRSLDAVNWTSFSNISYSGTGSRTLANTGLAASTTYYYRIRATGSGSTTSNPCPLIPTYVKATTSAGTGVQLLSDYTFDDAIGGQIANGALTGGTEVNDADSGHTGYLIGTGCLYLLDSDSYFNEASPSRPNSTSGGAVTGTESLWIKISQSNGITGPMFWAASHGTDATNTDIINHGAYGLISYNAGTGATTLNTVGWYSKNNSNSNQAAYTANANGVRVDNSWHLLTVSYALAAGSASDAKIYLDGAELTNTSTTETLTTTAGIGDFNEWGVSRDLRGNEAGSAGSMDDFAVWGTRLDVTNDTPIKALYNLGLTGVAGTKYNAKDASALFDAYTGHVSTTTSDSKVWVYVATGLTGALGSVGANYVVLGNGTGGGSDRAGMQIQQTLTAPVLSSVTAISSSTINLVWTDPVGNNETGFEIDRKVGAGSWVTNYTTLAANTTTYSNSGLTAGTQYYYCVRATNASGDSANSNEGNAITALTFYSVAAEDGYVTASTYNSALVNNGIQAGDLATNAQIKGILSFDTGTALPDTATITSATLRLRRNSLTGDNIPFSWGGGGIFFRADIKGGSGFGGSYALASGDFSATADATNVITGGTYNGLSCPVNNGDWSTGSLTSGLLNINKTDGGKTQFRVYFSAASNNDGTNDYLAFYTGGSASGYKPELVVFYTVAMRAADGEMTGREVEALTQEALQPVADAAMARWEAVLCATGYVNASSSSNLFANVQFVIADLSGDMLGATVGSTIYLDRDAAGYGWYTDALFANNLDFLHGKKEVGMDLLTVISHELGHVLGLGHSKQGVMSKTLEEGVRMLPSQRDLHGLSTIRGRSLAAALDAYLDSEVDAGEELLAGGTRW
jgi:hypothetical protein